MKALKTTVHYDVTAGRTHTEQTELSVMDEAMNTEHIVESNVVGIYPDYTFQMMEGYGCSLTESACYLLSKMDSATRKEALAQWFGPLEWTLGSSAYTSTPVITRSVSTRPLRILWPIPGGDLLD